jgi:hypothetical protein
MSGHRAGHGGLAAAAALALAVTLAQEAVAQLAKPGPAMSADEAKAALYGIDMQGYSTVLDAHGRPEGKGMTWRECITPKGETLYETPAGVEHGRLKIDGRGQACFAYEGTGYKDWNCFSAANIPTGFRFVGGFGDVFVTTSVQTGVKSCKARSDLIG